jgi:hypothetical protein
VTKLKQFFFFFYEVFKASLGFYCYSKLNKAQAEKLMGSNLAACCIKMRANNFMERLLLAQARSGPPQSLRTTRWNCATNKAFL